MKHEFILNNLDCANCAAIIEQETAKLDGVTDVNLAFALQKLTLVSDNDNIIEEIQKICDKLEENIKVAVANNPLSEDDEDEEEPNLILLIIAICLEVAAILLSFLWQTENPAKKFTILALTLTSAICSGYKVLWSGLKSLLKFSFTENVLMSVAVIPAFCIGEYIEAAMVTLLFAIGEIIEEIAIGKSRKSIKKLANIRPDMAIVTDEKDMSFQKTVPSQEVTIGSIIVVNPHCRIPLDGVVIKGQSTLDTSAITGESMPMEAGPQTNVLSGQMNLDGLLYIRTTKTFSESTASRILKLVEDAAGQKSKKEKAVGKFAKVYTPIVMILSILIAVIPPLFHLGDWSVWLYRGLICLVAGCPCAIVISVPLSYFATIGQASKNGILIKGAKYIDVLSNLDAVVWDKTGTLTEGSLEVKQIKSFDTDYSESDILSLCCALEKHSVHPIATAIKSKWDNKELPVMTEYHEIPGHGTTAVLNETMYKCGGANFLSDEQKKLYPQYNVYLLENDKLIGAIILSDMIRTEAKSVITALKKSGIKQNVMLTGDNESAAKQLSEELELTQYFAGLLPEQKLQKLQEIKETCENVAFVGDGINDSPVLSYSDCGIAMGFGSEAAIESADVVLSSGNLSPLPTAVKLAKKCIGIVSTNIAMAISVKALVVILGIFGLAWMWMSVLADTGLCVLCCILAVMGVRK